MIHRAPPRRRGRPSRRVYFYLPEAALMLRIPLRYLRTLLYDHHVPLSEQYAFVPGHSAKRRVLDDQDLDRLATIIAHRMMPKTPIGRPPVKRYLNAPENQP